MGSLDSGYQVAVRSPYGSTPSQPLLFDEQRRQMFTTGRQAIARTARQDARRAARAPAGDVPAPDREDEAARACAAAFTCWAFCTLVLPLVLRLDGGMK